MNKSRYAVIVGSMIFGLGVLASPAARGEVYNMDTVQLVQAGGGPLDVYLYSVPVFVDWDNDGRNDLLVGEKTAAGAGKIRLYLNSSPDEVPAFTSYSYIQAGGSDLALAGSGCMGLFPHVADWDSDGRKDLVVGEADGEVQVFLNSGTDAAPAFTAGQHLQVGGSNIDVGARACVEVVDWDNDGRKDLLAGAYDGKAHLYLNTGTDAAPAFSSEAFVQDGGADLDVPASRSSFVAVDFNDDGKKDLITGDTNGQLTIYENVGTDAAPAFDGFTDILSDFEPIDLVASRSRPFVCDWTGDGYLDILVGASDGLVYLYEGLPPSDVLLGDANHDDVVDVGDLGILAGNWGTTSGATWETGDFTGDGAVDVGDLGVLAGNWGQSAVPEPASMLLLAGGAVALIRRR